MTPKCSTCGEHYSVSAGLPAFIIFDDDSAEIGVDLIEFPEEFEAHCECGVTEISDDDLDTLATLVQQAVDKAEGEVTATVPIEEGTDGS